MQNPSAKRRALREKLASGKLVVAPGAHNGLSARLVQEAGFDAVYMTGSGVANTLTGGPDVGLLTMSEMTMMARFCAQAVDIPVISDADTGYGNAINVIRTVREYELTGVAGIHIEDQVNPKRCGSVAGKEVIPIDEARGKIQAAVEARTDPDFLIIARTDARGAVGLDEAIRRGQAYHEAGADMLFPDALLSVEEYERFAKEVPGLKMFNMGGYAKKRTTPKLPLEQVEAMGYAFCILPLLALRAGVQSMIDTLTAFKQEGIEYELKQLRAFENKPVENWYEFTGIGGIRDLEDRYLPADAVEQKYAASAGHKPGDADNRRGME
ncbi:MAG: isocitrate lyase/PEP mutase family protein [Alphaproteobacteria bacterium]|nr:isocitrate lyase/PEP mutase family protein [Alphaproteobacteria bacterium]